MSVNRNVRVPVGGLATALSSSSLPLSRHYSSVGYERPSVCSSAKVVSQPCRSCSSAAYRPREKVTDGTRTRAYRSHYRAAPLPLHTPKALHAASAPLEAAPMCSRAHASRSSLFCEHAFMMRVRWALLSPYSKSPQPMNTQGSLTLSGINYRQRRLDVSLGRTN